MAEGEIVNTLGFNVDEALKALQRLDDALQASGRAFGNYGAALDRFNDRAKAALAAMRGLATAAGRVSTVMQNTPAMATAGAAAGSQFWLPPGMEEEATRLSGALQGVGAAGAVAGRAVKTEMAGAGDATKKAKEQADHLTVTWGTLARVVATQAIVRTLSMMRDGIRESLESWLEFSKAVGEIRAIDPSRNFQQIAGDVRQLSDAFNQPLSTVAEAQYQTISDQFVTAADRANILTAANELAKVGADDLAASAQLLTGALNAYGESSDQAGLRAAQFFESVNLGRFRMSELGAAMGRVQSIGNELGLSMEELQAALITVTIGGVKATEAATQLRGVMTALLKPSEGMKEAFRELGVESGEAAIATWGLQGTLQQLMTLTHGSATEMARLFLNVRGLAGVLRIAGEGADKYQEAMERLRAVDQATLQKKLEEFTATDAEKLTRELNKLANFFVTEFGQTVVRSLANAAGGVDTLISGLRGLGGQLPEMIGVATAFAGTLLLLGTNAKLAALNLGTMRGALMLLAGVELSKLAGGMIGDKLAEMAQASGKALKEVFEAELRMHKEKSEAAVREAERRNDEIVKSLRQYAAEANKLYLQDAESFQRALRIQEQVAKLAFDRIMQARQAMTQELFKASEDAATKAAEIPQQIAAIGQAAADRAFTNLAQRFDPARQFGMFKSRAEELASQAAKLQGTAKDADQEKLADAAWKRSEAYARLAEQAAQQSGHLGQQRQAEQMLLDLDNKRIAALRQQQQTQQQVARELEARAQQAEAHNLELEAQRKEIEGKLKTTTETAGGDVIFKDKEQMKRDLSDAKRLIEEFEKSYKQFTKEDFTKAFAGDSRAFASLERAAEQALASADLKRIAVAPEAIASLYKELQASADKMRLEVPVIGRIENFTGLDAAAVGLQKLFDGYLAKINEASTHGIRQQYLQLDRAAEMGAFDTARDSFVKTTQTPPGYSYVESERNKLAQLTNEMDRLRQSSTITEQDITKLKTAIQGIDWSKAIPGSGGEAGMARNTAAAQLNVMIEALRKLKDTEAELQQLEKAAKEEPATKAQVDDINRQIEGLQQRKAASAEAANQTRQEQAAVDVLRATTDQAAVSAQQAGIALTTASQVSMAGLIGQIQSAVSAMWSLRDAAMAAAMASAAATSGGAEVATAARGGLMRYLDQGGFGPRGTDTIPVMLSPGEFVMNARSTRRFYSQLLAMNAGVAPVYRSHGGEVANITVGDIHINGASQPRETAREVIKSIRRELRRGTSPW